MGDHIRKYRKKEVNNMIQNLVNEILQENLDKNISAKVDTYGINGEKNLEELEIETDI